MEDNNISYLSFKVGNEIFALHASKVHEICEYRAPRNVPGDISFMSGVIDHRNEVIPVIDTGIKFGMDPIKISAQTCIIVIDVQRNGDKAFRVGVLTDAVTDVFEAEEEDFKPIDTDYSPDYIRATFKREEDFYLILNSDSVFSKNEVITLSNILKKIKTQ
ncbi:CheW protein [Saccharicrinis carchari]|uniref:CheW protein n=1 Tax=Saccharicrinis carchari TaxID=1168039 RepID=A0A521CEY2_SACCC|nr:chemotaxis protein CheW [Saccharicrinis carchari]SMO57962.1 CheW protein [Saccharicrinis carchari]